MTVRELIDRLLSEPMDAKVMIQTYEGDRKTIKGSDAKVNSVIFEIEGIEYWVRNYVFLNFTDWRASDDFCSRAER